MKKLCLTSELQRQIKQHCAEAYPREGCGLLLGRHDVSGGYVVTEVVPSRNLSPDPDISFEIDPALIIAFQKKARSGEDKIIGHFHSHPDGEARPSDRDQEQNYAPELIWVIVSVDNGKVMNVNAFDMGTSCSSMDQLIIKSSF